MLQSDEVTATQTIVFLYTSSSRQRQLLPLFTVYCWETAKTRQDFKSKKITKQVADKNIIAVNSVLKSLATPWSLVLQLLHKKHVQSDVMSFVAFFWWVAKKRGHTEHPKRKHTLSNWSKQSKETSAALAYVFFCVCVCQLFGWAHLEDFLWTTVTSERGVVKVLTLAYVPLLFGTGPSQSLDRCHKEAFRKVAFGSWFECFW